MKRLVSTLLAVTAIGASAFVLDAKAASTAAIVSPVAAMTPATPIAGVARQRLVSSPQRDLDATATAPDRLADGAPANPPTSLLRATPSAGDSR